MTDPDIASGPAAPLLATAGTFDGGGVWRERDAQPAPEVRTFVDALDRIPFVPDRTPVA